MIKILNKEKWESRVANIGIILIFLLCAFMIIIDRVYYDEIPLTRIFSRVLPIVPFMSVLFMWIFSDHNGCIRGEREKVGEWINFNDLKPGRYAILNVYNNGFNNKPMLLLLKASGAKDDENGKLVGSLPDFPENFRTWRNIKVEIMPEQKFPACNVAMEG